MAYVSVVQCQGLLVIWLQLGLWQWLAMIMRERLQFIEATDLLKAIIIYINWGDA